MLRLCALVVLIPCIILTAAGTSVQDPPQPEVVLTESMGPLLLSGAGIRLWVTPKRSIRRGGIATYYLELDERITRTRERLRVSEEQVRQIFPFLEAAATGERDPSVSRAEAVMIFATNSPIETRPILLRPTCLLRTSVGADETRVDLEPYGTFEKEELVAVIEQALERLDQLRQAKQAIEW